MPSLPYPSLRSSFIEYPVGTKKVPYKERDESLSLFRFFTIPISFEVGKKLRIRHEFEKSLSYYWNLYKLWIIILLGAFVFAFLVYVYKRLTRRPA